LPLSAGQTFAYVEALHDNGPKTVLGKRIEGSGRSEGQAVLDLLARHPSTARFIAGKLARRFVSDDPPGPLIDRMARTFTATDGDIRQVLRTLFVSPEFWSPEAFKAKVKTPFEYVVSAARATAAEMEAEPARAPVAGDRAGTAGTMAETMAATEGSAPRHTGANGLVRSLHALGQPLYGCRPPTGYKDEAEAWVSAGALLHRMRVVMGLAANRLQGIQTDVAAGLTGQSIDTDGLNALAFKLTGEFPLPETLQLMRQQLDLSANDLEQLGLPAEFGRSPRGPARMAAGWILAAPAFQRR
jgi:uncharacterized protein (DUF1800 family)